MEQEAVGYRVTKLNGYGNGIKAVISALSRTLSKC
jgi:hypothetical protein